MQMCLWRGETLPKCVCNQVHSAKCGEMEWGHGVTPLKQGEIKTSQKSLLLSYTAAGWVRNQQLYKIFNVKTYLIYYKNVWKYTSILQPPTHLGLRLFFCCLSTTGWCFTTWRYTWDPNCQTTFEGTFWDHIEYRCKCKCLVNLCARTLWKEMCEHGGSKEGNTERRRPW